MPKQNRDKTSGLPLPSPVDPGQTVCVSLMIPDAPEYIQAFRGVIADLGKFWAWSRTQGQSDEPAQEAAELWRKAANTIMYSEDCEGAMSCGQVQNCIDTDPATRTSIQNLITTQTSPGQLATPGQPMTIAQSTARLNALDGCNHDEFWAQCEQLVDYFVQAGTDVLEAIEVYTNAIEAAEFIEMIPILGTLFDELQIDQFLGFLDWVVETFTEWYVASDTEENRRQIKCDLFCAGFDDCLLTVDRIWGVLNERLGGILNPGDLETLGDLANALVTVLTDPALALDAWLAFVTGSVKFAGYLGVKGIDQTLTLVLKLAINDANNDWELLCEDCSTPPPDPDCEDLTASEGLWGPYLGNSVFATYFTGQGWGPTTQGPTSNPLLLQRSIEPVSRVVNHLRITVSQATDDWRIAAPGYTFVYSGAPTTVFEVDSTSVPSLFPMDLGAINLVIGPANGGANAPNASFRITEFCAWND